MRPRRYLLFALLILAAGLSLHLPSLQWGFFADDYTLMVRLGEGVASPKSAAWEVHDFGDFEEHTRENLRPWSRIWWGEPGWKLRFFRPFSGLLLSLDRGVWGRDARGYHLTNFALYLAILLLLLLVYRRLGLSQGAALIGLALFAGSNGGSLPVGWIAHRSTLIASLFTLLALLAWLRLRPPWRLPIALLLALLAVGGKESGLMALPLVAWAAWLEARRSPDPAVRRPARCAAAVALALGLVVLGALALAGYGARSLVYVTPWSDPWTYLRHAGVLLSAGLLRLLTPVPLDVVWMDPRLVVTAVAVGLVAALLLGRLLARRVGSHPAALFLAGWIPLGLLLKGGVWPSDRLLFDAAMGSAGLLGLLIVDLFSGRRLRDRALAVGLVLSAGVLPALFTSGHSSWMREAAGQMRESILRTELGPAAEGPVEAMVLQPGGAIFSLSLTPTWVLEGGRPGVCFHFLQERPRGLEWTREDARSLRIRSLDEPILSHFLEGLGRVSKEPPALGAVLAGDGYTVEVLEREPTGVRELRMCFDEPIDTSAWRFLVMGEGHLRRIEPPPVGETRVIPRAEPVLEFMP